MAKLGRAVRDDLAGRVMALIRFHSSYLPLSYGLQYLLPDGRYLTVTDSQVGKHRVLWFNSVTRGGYPNRSLSTLIERPKRLREVVPWFEGATDRELRRALSSIAFAIDFAWGNGDDIRESGMPLIDPYAPQERIDIEAWTRDPDPTENGRS